MNILLVVWILVHCTAVVFEIDEFPLTDAGMYSNWKKKEILSHLVRDLESYKQGFAVTRRDGSTGHVAMEDLNLTRRHMYQLYFQKVHIRPPLLVLRSLNHSLGHEPEDPDFIVRITVPYVTMHRRASDISKVWTEEDVTTVEWDEAWSDQW